MNLIGCFKQSVLKMFGNIKGLLCFAPNLLAPRVDQPFKLHLDASHIGAGTILLQAVKLKLSNLFIR